VTRFDQRDNIGAHSFFGSATSSLEEKLYGLVREDERGSKLDMFVKEVRSLQSGPDPISHEDMAAFMKQNNHTISAVVATHGIVQLVVTIDSEQVDVGRNIVDHGTVESNSALQDLAIILLLRFGSIEGIAGGVGAYSSATLSVVGANLVIDFLFKNNSDGAYADNARASLRRSMSVVSGDGSDDVEKAITLLKETRGLEDAERVVREKLLRVRVATRMVAIESTCVLILSVTVLGVVWWKGGIVLATNRIAAWAATILVMVYVVSRMLWLHLPRG
jgi:hypothetical protein